MNVNNQLTTQVLPVEGLPATNLAENNSGLTTRESNRPPVRLQIDLLVARIEHRASREIVSTVFEDLLCLLERMDWIQNHLRRVDQAVETFVLFQLIHDEARSLVEFIRTRALSADGITETLYETLDGITFAMNHDLQRVFGSELDGPIPNEPAVVVGKLIRSHGVLTNCLQQSAITLAMVFDPAFVGAKLFNNSDVRYWESIELCNELSDLIQLLACFEDKRDERARGSLAGGINKFHSQSMQFLMYTDWPEFESFCKRAISSLDEPQQLESVIHQFRCYLETLLSEVKMRAVLAEVFEFSDYLQFADPQLEVRLRGTSLRAGSGLELAA